MNEYNHRAIEEIMCLSRCYALIIYVARPGNGQHRVVVDVMVNDLLPIWCRGYRLCLLDGMLHVVPDYDASKRTLKLTKKGLTRCVEFDALSSEGGSSATIAINLTALEKESPRASRNHAWITDLARLRASLDAQLA